MAAAVSLDIDGHCLLVAPNEIPDGVAADEVATYAAQWCCTIRQEQVEAAATSLEQALSARPTIRSLGVEFATCGRHGQQAGSHGDDVSLVDFDRTMWRLRRRTDPDELALIRRAIDCTDAMYRTAREIIEPGITELEVFNQLQLAAVSEAGEPLTAPLGNDFQCNSPGGPPRSRAAQAGELFVLDLGPCFRGYYADNCRTIAVDGKPTNEQQRAWQAIVAVLTMVENSVRPGVSARRVYEQAKAMLDDFRPGAFPHHLGHGFGLFPHEAPHLNPSWDDIFEVGDSFTAEPGLYTPDLAAGIRLEQNYLVTETGVERLTNFPLELC